MALTISTYAGTTDLTTLAAVKETLGLTSEDAARDALLEKLISRATSAIESFCSRIFARQAYTETLAGYGTTEIVLGQAPLAGTSTPTVTYEGDTISTVAVGNRKAAILSLESGFNWTAVGSPHTMVDIAVPFSEQPDYSVAYTAGWLLPGDDMEVATLSAAASDDSFNDSASGFPLLVVGDRIKVSGFTESANNGTFTVVSRTAAKVVIDGTLADESAGDQVTVTVRNLPHDAEQACIETVKYWYLKRKTPAGIKSKRVGDLSIEYTTEGPQGMPLTAVHTLMMGGYQRMLGI